MRARAALVLLVACAGCGGRPAPKGEGDAPGPGALSPEEAAVKAWILEHADDPKSVRIGRFGPSDLKGEMSALYRKRYGPAGAGGGWHGEPGRALAKGALVVRVVYRARNRAGAMQRHDRIFYVLKGRVALPPGENPSGDDWLAVGRKNLSRPLPR